MRPTYLHRILSEGVRVPVSNVDRQHYHNLQKGGGVL